MRTVFIVALLTSLGLPPAPLAQAQPQDFTFEQIQLPSGFTPIFVTGIAQDPQGFLWVGTQGGVIKYDGYAFTSYTYNPLDSTSLSHNRVECLYVDREGTIWVGTFGAGLNRFDRKTETFTRFRHEEDNPGSLSDDVVTVILEDRDGGLWVGTHGGLNQLDPGAERFRRYVHDPEDPTSLSNDQVRSIYEDREGILWIGTGSPWESETGAGGLNRFNPETETFTRYLRDPSDEHSLINNQVLALYEDIRGTFWVGTWGDGLHSMDREKGTFMRHRYHPEKPRHLSRPRLERTSGEDNLSGVTFVQEDSAGALWIGAFGGGLNRWVPATGTLLHFEADPDDPLSLKDNLIWKLYQTRENTLWLGTSTGLYKIAQVQSNFSHYTLEPATLDDAIMDIHEDTVGKLWIGTIAGGLLRYERGTGAFKRYQPDLADPSTLSNGQVMDIYEDRAGVLWVGTGGGLNRFDRAREAFTRYTHDPDDPHSLSHDFITRIYEDSSGVLWIGTMGRGLNQMDRATGTFARHLIGPSKPGGPSNTVRAISEDRSGGLWIGTGAGLHRFDRERGSFTSYLHEASDPGSLSSNEISDIYADPQGRLWIGTRGGGLNLFDVATGTFTHFITGNSGLPTNDVLSIQEDAAGMLWLGAGQALVRFDPKVNTFHTFDLEHGLRTGGPGSVDGYLTSHGELLFASVDGFYAFFPARVEETVNTYPPQVVLTDLQIFNNPVRPGPTGPLREALSETDEIRLSHEEHDLTFGFAALHYRAPLKNRYAYMLEGYDEAWRDVGTERSATYTNLDPGRYVFRVKAANSDGIWNEEGASVRVVILPPWFRTWWAYLLYGLLFIGGVFTADRFQRRRLIKRERTRAEREAEKLRVEAAEHLSNYLQSENLRQTQELDAARKLQLSMLPEHVPEHPLFEIAAVMKTATEVGGDYYDFDLARDGTLTFVIGDATGHGAEAGIMVTAMKSLWNAFARDSDLEEVLCKSNQALKRMHLPKLYMALALGRLQGLRLDLVGAGMPPALLYRAATGEVESIALKGIPLGGPGALPYRQTSVALSPGDTLVLMSDGFPESFNGSRAMLGYEQASEALVEVGKRSPKEIIAHFLEGAKAWSNGHGQDDDMTFIVMKVKP